MPVAKISEKQGRSTFEGIFSMLSFEILINYSVGDTEQAIGYMNVELKGK